MALKLADVVQEMKTLFQNQELSPDQRFRRILEQAAGFLEPALGRTGEDTTSAILMLDAESERLSFAYPLHLANGNYLPADGDSIAGRVVREKGSLVVNQVIEEPHKDFFERIPDGQGRVRLIQKMIAAPFVDKEQKVLGVVEVNRTGDTLADAGPDFTHADAQNLEKCCKVFAPYVVRSWAAAGRP